MLKEHSKWLVALNIHKATDTIGRKVPPERRHGIGSPTIAKWLKEHPEWLISVKIFTDIKHAQKGKKGMGQV